MADSGWSGDGLAVTLSAQVANLIVANSPLIDWYTDLFPFFALIESTVRKHAWLWKLRYMQLLQGYTSQLRSR